MIQWKTAGNTKSEGTYLTLNFSVLSYLPLLFSYTHISFLKRHCPVLFCPFIVGPWSTLSHLVLVSSEYCQYTVTSMWILLSYYFNSEIHLFFFQGEANVICPVVYCSATCFIDFSLASQRLIIYSSKFWLFGVEWLFLVIWDEAIWYENLKHGLWTHLFEFHLLHTYMTLGKLFNLAKYHHWSSRDDKSFNIS